MNYYELLEISPSASAEIIRNAYKTLAKKYHPDTYRGDTSFAEEKMKLLNEAISVLEDEDKRNEYNKINGLDPLSKPGHSEYGSRGMINVDENGEPVFFSDDLDDSADSESVSYMDIIDNFIKNSKSDAKASKKKKKALKKKEKEIIPDEIIADIAADISEINAKKFGTDGADLDYSDSNDPDIPDEDAGQEEGEDDGVEEDAAEESVKTKSYAARLKLFYIILAFFIVSIIVLFILIMQNVNLDNIRDMFSGIGGGGPGSEEDTQEIFPEDDFISEEDIDFDEQTPDITAEPTDSLMTEDIPEPVTPPPFEIEPAPSAEPISTEAAATTSAPAPTTGRPAATAAPTTERRTEPPPTTTEHRTEPPAPETEETTEEATTAEETSAEEETVPPETEETAEETVAAEPATEEETVPPETAPDGTNEEE